MVRSAPGQRFQFPRLQHRLPEILPPLRKIGLRDAGDRRLTTGNTPFRKLEELGGADMMRGYYAGRFTDKCLMAYQAEYRRQLFWRIGMVAFASTGEVSPDLKDFELNPDQWHYAYGGGLRFMLSKEEKLNLRVDYGIAKHSNAFNVQLREAF